MIARMLAVALLVPLAAGCIGSRDLPPDDRFSHRYTTEDAPDDRRTVTLLEPDEGSYFYYPVHIDSLHIRPGSFVPYLDTEVQRVAVEVLVKGVYPDDCSDVAVLEQHRVGHLIEVDLLMRKPQDSVCFRVRRPFRYYFTLDGSYRPGHYTLKLNGAVHPFEVRARRR